MRKKVRYLATPAVRVGRVVALDLISRDGETNLRTLIDHMLANKLLEPRDLIDARWTASIFRSDDFIWTGRWHSSPAPAAYAHNSGWNLYRPVKVWTAGWTRTNNA